MSRHDEPPAPDDFELGDLENEAFIPSGGVSHRNLRRKSSMLTDWMPVRVQKFVENVSRIKVSSEIHGFSPSLTSHVLSGHFHLAGPFCRHSGLLRVDE